MRPRPRYRLVLDLSTTILGAPLIRKGAVGVGRTDRGERPWGMPSAPPATGPAKAALLDAPAEGSN